MMTKKYKVVYIGGGDEIIFANDFIRMDGDRAVFLMSSHEFSVFGVDYVEEV